MTISNMLPVARSLAISLILAAWVTTPLHAQTDPKAEQILSKSNQKLSNAQDISASFSQELIVSGNTRSSKAGTLKMKQDKFRVELSDQTLICNGVKLWRVLPEEEEVSVSKYDKEDGFSPERMFTISQKEMKSKHLGTENVGGQLSDKIALFPKTEKDYWKIEMYVAQGTSLPSKMVIFNRTGSQVVYNLSRVQLNSGVSDALFSFRNSDCPDCEIIQE